MPRRKKCAPVRSAQDGENWTGASGKSSGNLVGVQDDIDTPVKKSKTFTAFLPALKYSTKDEKLFLGKLSIGHTNNILPEEWKNSKVSLLEDSLHLSFDQKSDILVHLTYDISIIKGIFTSKIFKFNFIADGEEVFLCLYLRDVPIPKINKAIGQVMQELMAVLYNIDTTGIYEKIDYGTDENLEELYRDINNCRKKKVSEIAIEKCDVQHPHLLPVLRPYQRDAVQWMIQKEKLLAAPETFLSPMYIPIKLMSGIEVYYNKYLGYIERTKPTVQCSQTGGILADEMGLGKTVEVLACILNHPRILDSNLDEIQIKKDISGDIETQNLDKTEGTNQDLNKDNEIKDEQVIDLNNETRDEQVSELSKSVPTIETQSKYSRPKVKKTKAKKVTKPKKPEKIQKKSAAKIAAQIWYENKLAEVKIKTRVRSLAPVDEVQCVCGDLTTTGTVKCKTCRKIQHAACMGYKGDNCSYFCPQCWANKPLIKSKATLIVSPVAISRQWSLEVQRHIRSNGLKVLEYKGVHLAGMVYPTELAEYDLVITTYSVLRSELRFVFEEQPTFSLRNSKRYCLATSSLLHVEWWRVCLDEAQSVECPSSQVACMARHLAAAHRWAVTGTPAQKHVNDIYGLIEYLQLTPFNDVSTWNHILYYPYINGNKQPMIEFLSQILWRTSKTDVIEQINIPSQTIEEHWLEFSAVEKFFYRREHELNATNFLAKLRKFNSLDMTLKSLDRQTLNLLLAPLLSLRQACTHPHAVRGKYLASRRLVNSMEELLDALIKKSVNDCEESLRAVIADLNGVAGILILQERTLEAVEKYREALLYMSKYDNEEFVKVDKLQRIHTLHNLSEILSNKSYPAAPPTLRDDKLKEECELYQCRYMEKYITQTRSAFDEAKSASTAVEELRSKLVLDEGEWCSELLDWFVERSLDEELCKRIDNALDQTSNKKYDGMCTRTLNYHITTWIDKVLHQSKKLRSLFDEFESALCLKGNKYISQKIVDSAMECHLRPAKNKKSKQPCLLCVLDNNLKKYECIIFRMNKKNKDTESNNGTWHPSREETVLKAIYSFGKSRGADEILIHDGETHIALCESQRKEFKEIRKLYMFYDQQVSAQDELEICKIRFRLRNLDEPVKEIQKKKKVLQNLDYEIENKFEFIHVLNYFELDYHLDLLKEGKVLNDENFKKQLGTHHYLETLRKQQYAGQQPDPCPICSSQLTETWCILHCGHCYCLECIHKLLDQNRNGTYVTCCVCRKKQLRNDISYIKVSGSVENTIDDMEIKGSYSTKVQAVVRCVLKLREEDATVKVLIFSTWHTVLKVLSEAFTTNSVLHELITTYNLQEKLKRFKAQNKDENVTALLLPVRLGAKGLNLIEATHVLLVEPLMNPGEELQAIGRVHRIGQTKPTVVHRFLVKNTIEESIHNAISTNVQQWDNNKLTLNQLKELFTENVAENVTEKVDDAL